VSALNPRQQRFVEEYPKDLNATQAYIRAGYSPHGADRLASRLMRHDGVTAAISRAIAKRSERTRVTTDDVLLRTAAPALVDPRSVVTWDKDGAIVRDSTELTPEEAATVAEIKVTPSKDGDTVTVKFRDPTPHLALLARHLGIIADGAVVHIDNRQQSVTLPEGTTLGDLLTLRDELRGAG
jgi:phage terminase small subunit